MLNKDFYPKEQLALNPQIDPNAAFGAITGADLTPTQPIQIPPTPTPTPADTTGGQAMIDSFNQMLKDTGTKDADSMTSLFEKYLSGSTPPASQAGAFEEASQAAGIPVKEQDVITKQVSSQAARNKLAAINAELAGLSVEAQAIPIRLQEESTGRGITEGGLKPIEAGELRKLALRTLPVQAKALGIQAEVFAAQGDVELSQQTLKLAQDKLFQVFQLRTKDVENQYNYWKNLRERIFDFATAVEKNKLAIQQKKDDQAHSDYVNEINDLQAKAGTLMAGGQGELAAKLSLLDPKSPTYKADKAALIAQAKPTTAAGIKATTMGVDTTGLPQKFINAINIGKTGTELLNSLAPLDKATLTSILNYEKNPANLSLRKSAGEAQSEREKFLSMAHLIDPTYDETQYAIRSAVKKDFNSGKSAQNIRSLNTAVGHLQTLADAGTKLENSSVTLWNSIRNRGLTSVGDPRVINFNTAATAVESELASVFKGMGATDQEIKAWRENINSSQSPEQIKGAINTAIELMGSRLQALTNQYELGIGKPKDFRILSDKSRQILSGLGIDVNALDPVSQENQETYQTPDGKVYVKGPDGLYYPK